MGLIVDQRLGKSNEQAAELANDFRGVKEQLAGVVDDVRGVRERVIEQQASIDGLTRTSARVEAAMQRLEHAVLGNGSPGLDELMRLQNRRWAIVSKLVWVALGGVVSLAVAMITRVFET